SASFFMQGPFLVFTIRGNAFLWKMVRSVLGTILELEREKASVSALEKLLASRKRENAGTTLPPKGLFLHEVSYGTEFRI
ncbi:MAG TPA: tRNA pseudouridine(38-40) synthase TruA, partial [Spirochaetia bacterium]|nr:tRNA pseudouridine(38-40) synthase TruA [Spirochaetia bacterium]